MGESHKKKKDSLLNRQLIIDAAAEIGASNDWHAVTFQAIADKVGLSKGGIIHHFQTKDDLLEEMMRQSLDELTLWINQDMELNGSDNPSIAYLRFVINKSDDEKYLRTTKVIIQAIATGNFHAMWEDWFKKNITEKSSPQTDEITLIIQLVSDALWYADGLGYPRISDLQKQKLFNKLITLR